MTKARGRHRSTKAKERTDEHVVVPAEDTAGHDNHQTAAGENNHAAAGENNQAGAAEQAAAGHINQESAGGRNNHEMGAGRNNHKADRLAKSGKPRVPTQPGGPDPQPTEDIAGGPW